MFELAEDALLADGLEDALIGSTWDGKAVYDVDRCIDILSKSMTPDEAYEYLEFNTFSAYVGEMTPIYIHLKD